MNTYDYSDRVAVITGGCNGIGAAVTERMVKSGARVAIWNMNISVVEAKISALLQESIKLVEVDVSDLDSVTAAKTATEAAFGGIDILVNSAGIAGKEGNPNASAYSASKVGVIALTKSLSKQLASQDIAVNSSLPQPPKPAFWIRSVRSSSIACCRKFHAPLRDG